MTDFVTREEAKLFTCPNPNCTCTRGRLARTVIDLIDKLTGEPEDDDEVG